MNKRTSFAAFKEKALKNAQVKEAYEQLRPGFELMIRFIKSRKSSKLSQKSTC